MDVNATPGGPSIDKDFPPVTRDFVRGADIFKKLQSGEMDVADAVTLWDCIGVAVEERRIGLDELREQAKTAVIVGPDGRTVTSSSELEKVVGRGTTYSTIRFKPKTVEDQQAAIKMAREHPNGGGRTIIIEAPAAIQEKKSECTLQ